MDDGAFIRGYYDVPARKHVAIRFQGKPGVIVGFDQGCYLLAILEGSDEPVVLHPTWQIQYYPEGFDS